MKFCPNCSTLLKIVDSIDDLSIQKGGSKEFKDVIDTLVNENTIPTSVNSDNVYDILQSSNYKNLPIDEQEIVFNKLQSILPANKKKQIVKKTSSSDSKSIYYTCVDCSYFKELQPKTLIYSETKNKLDTTIPDLSYMVHNNILPRTTEYTCINDDCSSHKDGGVAVYLRYNNKIIHQSKLLPGSPS